MAGPRASIEKVEARKREHTFFCVVTPCKYGHLAPRLVSSGGCLQCSMERAAEWSKQFRVRDREKRKAEYARDRELNIQKAVEWNRNNLDKRLVTTTKYSKSAKGRAAALRAALKRQFLVRQASVAWRNQPLIDAIYEEAKLVGMVVDHIIPISHPLVSGLHCEANLMIVSKRANRRKSNSYR